MRKLVVDSCVISASGLVYFIFGCRYLDKQENYYIIAGDFNAKHTSWKNEINNTRGKSVRTWLDNKSIFYKTNLYSSELPSYPKGRSYLDICLADAWIKFQNIRPNNTLTVCWWVPKGADVCPLPCEVHKTPSDAHLSKPNPTNLAKG